MAKPSRSIPLLFGDMVLARKDVPASYHLAVVVDDAFQGVTLVTRGEDLLPATHVQRLLQALLALPEPAYAHHRLILDDAGPQIFQARPGGDAAGPARRPGVTPARYLRPAWALSAAYAMGRAMSDHAHRPAVRHHRRAQGGGDADASYTAKLLSEGVAKCAKKFGEEAVEAALAAVSGDKAAAGRRIRRCALSSAGAVGGGRHHARMMSMPR